MAKEVGDLQRKSPQTNGLKMGSKHSRINIPIDVQWQQAPSWMELLRLWSQEG